jgi:hypothetical protein
MFERCGLIVQLLMMLLKPCGKGSDNVTAGMYGIGNNSTLAAVTIAMKEARKGSRLNKKYAICKQCDPAFTPLNKFICVHFANFTVVTA